MSKNTLISIAVVLALILTASAAGFASGTQAVSTDVKQLSILAQEGVSANVVPSNDLPIYAALNKVTGIELQWETIPVAQFSQMAATRMASGNLPDMITAPFGIEELSRYAKNGVILELKDADVKKYAPKTWEFLSQKGGLYAVNNRSMYTGSLITFPNSIVMEKEWQVGLSLNKKWMTKLKLTDPTTTDEFYNVLKAFKTKDPNANGQADEVPVSTLWNLIDTLGNSFGLQIGWNGSSFHADAKGKVICDYTNPRLKDYVTWMNKLYTEGLLDKEYETLMQLDLSNQKIAKDTVGAMVMFTAFMTIWGPLTGPDGEPEDYYTIRPLRGPYGDSYNIARYPSGPGFVFSKTCRSLPVALKWYDTVMWDPKAQDLATWGIEGLTYKINAAGDKEMTVSIEELCKLGGGNWSLPYVQSSAVYDIQYKPYTQWDVKNMRPYFIDGFVTAPLTTEEADKIKTKTADITTYFKEMKSKFVSGAEPLSGFDAYVAKIKSMGIDEVTAIYQAAYDRRKK